MKTTFAIAAVAGFAAAASAQSVYISASNELPADGETVTLDVVLDATSYAQPFFAWHQYNFNINMSADGSNQSLAAAVSGDLGETNIAQTADTTGFAAGGLPWDGGRRPGAFPGSASNNGGSRFGPGLADVVTDGGISSSEGSIGGRQQASGAPENNALINSERVYEAFRFQFTYSEDMGIVTFDLADVVANLYNVAGTDNVFVQDSSTISGVSIGVPTPASAALLGLGGLAAARRRRA